jgi:hypothetical protein
VLDGLWLLMVQHLQYHHNLIQSWRESPISTRIWSIRWMVSQHQLIIFITCDLNRNSGLIVGQVRAIFQLPGEFGTFPDPLVYIEWFTAFQSPVPDLEMYQVSLSTRQHRQHASIIPVMQIEGSIHLIPKFGQRIDPSWSAEDVLERCRTFYVNPYLCHLDFLLFRYLLA